MSDIPDITCTDTDVNRVTDWIRTLGANPDEIRYDQVTDDTLGTIVVLRDPISGESMTIGAST